MSFLMTTALVWTTSLGFSDYELINFQKHLSSSQFKEYAQLSQIPFMNPVKQELGLDFKEIATVYLVPNPKVYEKIGHLYHLSSLPQTPAIAFGNQTLISTEGIVESWEKVGLFTHELTHILFNQHDLEHKIPDWLNEGISLHFQLTEPFKMSPGNPALTHMIENSIKGAIHANQTVMSMNLPLWSLATKQSPSEALPILDQNHYELQAAQWAVTEILLSRKGHHLNRYLELLKQGWTHEKAFEEAFGWTEQTLFEEAQNIIMTWS